jgi:hypothetical protein
MGELATDTDIFNWTLMQTTENHPIRWAKKQSPINSPSEKSAYGTFFPQDETYEFLQGDTEQQEPNPWT